MSKDSRSGGKYTGNHTTLVPLAALACDVANSVREVTKITPGIIKAGLPSVSGRRRIKFTGDNHNTILLSVRDNTSHQDVYVYTTDKQTAMTAIARGVLNAGIAISFSKTD